MRRKQDSLLLEYPLEAEFRDSLKRILEEIENVFSAGLLVFAVAEFACHVRVFVSEDVFSPLVGEFALLFGGFLVLFFVLILPNVVFLVLLSRAFLPALFSLVVFFGRSAILQRFLDSI